MFKAKFNDKKFKTNVRLCINRLKLVEKKKTEMALKARKDIADYIKIGKTGQRMINVVCRVLFCTNVAFNDFMLNFRPRSNSS